MANRWGNSGNSGWLYFLGLQSHCRWWLQPWNQKTLTPWKKSYDQHRQHIQKQSHYFANKGPSTQSFGFSGSHVWAWVLDYKENWGLKNWCFWTVVLDKTLDSPLDCKEIQLILYFQSILKEISPEYSLEELMLKPKVQYFGHLMWRAVSLEKTLGQIEGKRRRGWQRMRWPDSITNSMDTNLSKLGDSKGPGNLACYTIYGIRKSWTGLN